MIEVFMDAATFTSFIHPAFRCIASPPKILFLRVIVHKHLFQERICLFLHIIVSMHAQLAAVNH